MHIGIDATALPPNPVGAGQYIIHLIRALARQPGEFEFTVFAQPTGRALLGIRETPRLRLLEVAEKSPARRLLWEQLAFPRLIRQAGVDLLHALHYTMPLAYPGRCVVTFHDMTFFLYPQLHTLSKRYFFRLFIHLSARRATALIADSESTRQDAIRLAGVPPHKITTVLLGVTEDFRPEPDPARRQAIRQKYDLPPRFALFVGLMEPRKNLPTLLRAYARIAAQAPDHRLVIVGRKGWMYTEALRLVESLGLGARVHFTGYVAQEDLPLVYNLADVFVYPSFYEGFGLPVLEAMACGTPVITTNVSSMPEIAGEAGVLLPPGDDRQLAQALLDLLRDPARRRQLSEAGLQRAAAFTWDRTAAETLTVYRQALATQST
jgi:glycosyltransferase involved in cell wall biosynthesis